jgi:Fe-S-cluster containining protein
MLLLDGDVQRIVALGFEEDYFSTNSDGFKMLRNSESGRCVFHDGKQCTIYANRPTGCQLYPIVFSEDLNRAVKDRFCPFRAEFELPLDVKRELTDIYVRIMDERKRRREEEKAHKGGRTSKSN